MKHIKLLKGLIGLPCLFAGLTPIIATTSCSKNNINYVTMRKRHTRLNNEVYESTKHLSLYFIQNNLQNPEATKVKIANLKLDGVETESRDKLVTYRTDSAGNILVLVDTQMLRTGIISQAQEATFDLVFTNKKTNTTYTISDFKVTWKPTPNFSEAKVLVENKMGTPMFFSANITDQDIQYSFDDTKWNKYESGQSIELSDGATLAIKGNNPTKFSTKDSQCTLSFAKPKENYPPKEEEDEEEEDFDPEVWFGSTNQSYSNETVNAGEELNVSGNVMGLLNNGGENTSFDVTTIPNDYCFASLFHNTNKNCLITSVSQDFLPAENLTSFCYASMFRLGKITEAPKLLSKHLAEGCYDGMFDSCESLTSYTKLEATELKPRCYESMFNGCRSLIAPQDELPALNLPDRCYEGMFRWCNSITVAPIIKGTTFGVESCELMFENCESLSITESTGSTAFFTCPSGASGENAFNEMFLSTKGPYTSDPQPGKTYYYNE